MRRRAKQKQSADDGPVVFDAQGVPVGVHVPVAPAVDDSRHARRLRRYEALRHTRELESQHRLRCEVSLFCFDPPH
jgi:hypothetical protein